MTPTFQARWILETLHLPLSLASSRLETVFNSIVTDSRKIRPGCLFVALPGEKFDGHDFIEAAVSQGATGILCREDRMPATPDVREKAIFFPVTDTLAAYREIGKAWRQHFSFPVVMVAGSNGKTTTKELLAALLRGRFKSVHKTQGSQNGFVGIPMTLLELNPSHQAAVIEVGIDEPGAMIQHVNAVHPTHSVLTIVGPEHLEKLIDLETVAREEGLALAEVAIQGGSVAINCDDPSILPHYTGIRSAKKLGYTLNPEDRDPAKLHGRISEDLRSLEVSGAGLGRAERFELPLLGNHNAMNLLSAIAVSHLLGLTIDEMRDGLQGFAGPEGRSQIRRLSDGTQVICDYYNSQPASLKAGLELAEQLAKDSPKTAQRWACLADMLELGPEEEAFHRQPARWIERLGIDHVALFGPRMKWLADELKKAGFRGFLKHFDRKEELTQTLINQAVAGSIILIKGSHGMRMEEVWKPFEQARQ